MSEPFVGELRLVGFNFAPVDWMQCQGQLIAISENSTLYNLIGTTYGGDGQQTFQLPDLRSRIPVHMGSLSGGSTYVLGQTGGVETVTISLNQIPSHNHSAAVAANAQSASASPLNSIPCQGVQVYATEAPVEAMAASSVSNVGSSLPHTNLQPFLALNWIISMYGIYPSQS